MGTADITMGAGSSIDAGAGTVRMEGNFIASFNAAGKTYDGSTSATGTGFAVSGLTFAADSNLSLAPPDSTQINFARSGAGTGKSVTATGFGVAGYAAGASTQLLDSSGFGLVAYSVADIAARPLDLSGSADVASAADGLYRPGPRCRVP